MKLDSILHFGIKSARVDVLAKRVDDLSTLISFGKVEVLPLFHWVSLAPEINLHPLKVSEWCTPSIEFVEYF
jgi:hypothetical protein